MKWKRIPQSNCFLSISFFYYCRAQQHLLLHNIDEIFSPFQPYIKSNTTPNKTWSNFTTETLFSVAMDDLSMIFMISSSIQIYNCHKRSNLAIPWDLKYEFSIAFTLSVWIQNDPTLPNTTFILIQQTPRELTLSPSQLISCFIDCTASDKQSIHDLTWTND